MFAVRYDMQNMPLCMQNTPAICANEVIGSSDGLVPINALLAYLTAQMALGLAGFAKGKTVLSPAIGGSVGNAVSQLARAQGAKHAISTTTNHAKAQQARYLGFDEVIDLSEEKLSDGVRRITGGYGAA